MDSILFLIFAAISVVCGVNLVLQKHPISSALSLVGVMGSLAVLYLLLGGEFIAMAQLIVYAGAIMVLFIFVIMLLNAGGETRGKKRLWASYAGAPMIAAIIGIGAYLIQHAVPHTAEVTFGAFQHGNPFDIGTSLFENYVLPFEITSILILIAIVGAIVLARKEIE
ncbi:MAG TPA: NADH-quinone oxidoreductase subunit J [Bryobacteraceae bacterium]|jgi:NADH-quinone oxidoreductase subunit J|nr:NADH-quinone oxidoreductase subunit J [Bryobacteraceae bacterium]